MCPTGSSVGWHHRFPTQPPLESLDHQHRLHCVVFTVVHFLLYETYGLVVLRVHKAFIEQQSDKNYRVEGEDNSPLWSTRLHQPASNLHSLHPTPILTMFASEAIMPLPIYFLYANFQDI
jgi:hypothetical protein